MFGHLFLETMSTLGSLGYMSCSEQSWYKPPSVIFCQEVPWSHHLCRTEVGLSSTLIPELALTSSQLRLFHRKFFQLSSSKMPLGLPRWLRVKGLQCRRHGWGRSPGGGDGHPLQYSCLENSLDRGAWQAIVHGVTRSHSTNAHERLNRTGKQIPGHCRCWGIFFF